MAKTINIFSSNKKNLFAENLQRISQVEGVADCALLDRTGNLLHRSSSSIGQENEFIACFDDIQGLMAIVQTYLGDQNRCETIHLYCATGEIVIWDLGPFVFFVTGHGIRCSAELRLRARILKNELITNPKLQKYHQALQTNVNTFKPIESERVLYSALIGENINNEQP